MKSIITDDLRTCYICGGRATEKHHIMHGYSGIDRKLSERYGLTVGLCHRCHNEPPNGVHFNAAKQAFKRDTAEVMYDTAKEHVNALKLQIRVLDAQIAREWGSNG